MGSNCIRFLRRVFFLELGRVSCFFGFFEGFCFVVDFFVDIRDFCVKFVFFFYLVRFGFVVEEFIVFFW